MMRVFITVILILTSLHLTAQNRVSYSQYMHNHQVFNPAFVEESTNLGGSVLYRNQWMGIEGTPVSFIGDVFYGFRGHNFDVQFLHDQITVFKHLEIGASYSYSVNLGRYTRMAMGIKASFNQQTANYNELSYFDGGDPSLSGTVKQIGVNFGAGLFVRNKNWHVGLGAPYLFNNGNVSPQSTMFGDMTYQHFFLTGGYRFVNDRDFQFYPTTLIKWTKGSPLTVSLDMNFLFRNRFWGSAGYRIDHTIILSAGIILWKNFKVVYSYDLGLGKVNRLGGMTHEVSLGYGISLFKDSFEKRKFINKKGGRKRIRKSRWK
ncbi:MAG: PorP/SprF family type IX secretion system membrane protein [Crocinitomicaceae bacterium]